MRGLRTTIALVVVLAGLVAYIYFVTWKKPAEALPKQEKVFASVDADKIDEVTIAGSAGETTTVKKDKGGWAIVKPIDARADEQELSLVTNNLANLEIQRVVDDKAGDLKQYGLEKPRIAIDFKAGKDEHKLLIGDKTPTGADLFAMRANQNRVFLIPSTDETTFDHTTFQLRDKRLFKFDREKVDAIELTADGKTVDLQKSGTDWKITKPLQAPADFGSVENVLGRLETVQMKSIVTENATPADLKKYGLDKPQETATLNLGSARAILALGDTADDTSVYVRDESRPVVMTVEKALVDDLKKGADDYRRKDLFDFRAYNANEITFTRAGQSVTFDKVKGKDGVESWRRTKPTAKDVDKDTMDGMLSRLSNARATAFVDANANTGLNQPALVVDVKFEDNQKLEHVTFGKAGNDVYAARPGQPGAAKVDATDFEMVTKSLDELSK